MSSFQLNEKTLETSIDRSADSFLVYDNSAQALRRTNINSALDLTSHPVGINDLQTLTQKTLTAPTISSPVLSGTVTGTYTIGGTPTFPVSVVTLTGSQTLTNKTLTSPTINTATIVNPTITLDALSEYTAGAGITIDGVLLKDSKIGANGVNTASIEDSAVTGAKIASYRLRSQADTTNATQTTATVQTGWGQILGNGTTGMTETVTFPTAVTTVLGLSINWIGYKSGGTAATAITEFNTKVGAGFWVESINITATGFTAAFSGTSNFGAAYHGYSWTVWAI